MDRTELKIALSPFIAKCTEKGQPISDICVEPAYSGDSSTSFIIQVKAPWVDNMLCSVAIDFLFDALWDTTTEDVRKSIFSIQVLDSNEQLHCWSDAPPEPSQVLTKGAIIE